MVNRIQSTAGYCPHQGKEKNKQQFTKEITPTCFIPEFIKFRLTQENERKYCYSISIKLFILYNLNVSMYEFCGQK